MRRRGIAYALLGNRSREMDSNALCATIENLVSPLDSVSPRDYEQRPIELSASPSHAWTNHSVYVLTTRCT